MITISTGFSIVEKYLDGIILRDTLSDILYLGTRLSGEITDLSFLTATDGTDPYWYQFDTLYLNRTNIASVKTLTDGYRVTTLHGHSFKVSSLPASISKLLSFSPVDLYAHIAASDPHGDRAYADGLVASVLTLIGNFTPSGSYPSTGGTGPSGSIRKGNLWIAAAAGTMGSKSVQIGDSFYARIDSPGQTDANWEILETNISFVPEDSANKSTDSTFAANSDTLYPSQKAVKSYVAATVAASAPSILTGLNIVEDFNGNFYERYFRPSSNFYRASMAQLESASNCADFYGTVWITGNDSWFEYYESNPGVSSNPWAETKRLKLGTGPIKFGARVAFIDHSNYSVRTYSPSTNRHLVGIYDHPSIGSIANIQGCFFDVDTTGYWKCITKDGVGTTTTVTSVALQYNTAYWLYVDASTTEVKFYIATNTGALSLVATHTTNIPAGSYWLTVGNRNPVNSLTFGITIDTFTLNQTFTTARHMPTP